MSRRGKSGRVLDGQSVNVLLSSDQGFFISLTLSLIHDSSSVWLHQTLESSLDSEALSMSTSDSTKSITSATETFSSPEEASSTVRAAWVVRPSSTDGIGSEAPLDLGLCSTGEAGS